MTHGPLTWPLVRVNLYPSEFPYSMTAPNSKCVSLMFLMSLSHHMAHPLVLGCFLDLLVTLLFLLMSHIVNFMYIKKRRISTLVMDSFFSLYFQVSSPSECPQALLGKSENSVIPIFVHPVTSTSFLRNMTLMSMRLYVFPITSDT